MLFFTKRIVISSHAKKRYVERVAKKPLSQKALRQSILNDFQVKAIRRKTIKDENNEFKVWVHGSRLYACVETPKTIIIKTVIQMLPENEQRIIDEIEKSL